MQSDKDAGMKKNITIFFLLVCFVFVYKFGLCFQDNSIHVESVKPSVDIIAGRPLPLAAHWNCGELPGGFTPRFQLKLLEAGHHILPWFKLNDPGTYLSPFPYEELIKFSAQHNLPISFISSQWEKLLSTRKKYLNQPRESNPNVILSNGTIERAVSPFSRQGDWHAVGVLWTSQPILKKIQEWYPNPPFVLFISNNEHPKLNWTDIERTQQYIMHKYEIGDSDEDKRQFVGDAWIRLYGALFNGMKDGLSAQSWKSYARFIGYNAFPDGSLWRWDGWTKYSLHVRERFEPWSHVWDGASISYYTHDWDPSVDFTAWSPQVRAMNLVPLLEDVYRRNPNYWLELSIWDGSRPESPKTDKRRYYAALGQEYSPERYGGMVQFGMWLLRPRVVREFRGWTEKVEDTGAYFAQILNAVDKVYENQILEKFWRNGVLIANRNGQHPHQRSVPEKYREIDRWFLLDTNLDPRKPWTLETEIPVFALALLLGKSPNREWLIYAFSPLVDERDVTLLIPGYGHVKIVAGIAGNFYHVQEKFGAVQRIE